MVLAIEKLEVKSKQEDSGKDRKRVRRNLKMGGEKNTTVGRWVREGWV